MPRCVVGGCSNVHSEHISCHLFPKTEKYRCLWTKFVQNTRADFRNPGQYSNVCSEHFEEHCFDPQYALKIKLGIKARFRKTLLPDAVPTIKVPGRRNDGA